MPIQSKTLLDSPKLVSLVASLASRTVHRLFSLRLGRLVDLRTAWRDTSYMCAQNHPLSAFRVFLGVSMAKGTFQEQKRSARQKQAEHTCSPRAADDPWRLLFWESPIGSAASHTSGSACPDPSSAGLSLAADSQAVESLAADWLPAAVPPAAPAAMGQVQVLICHFGAPI